MSQPVIPLNRPVNAFPRRFGKHILVQKLAEGGMAELFIAKQLGAEGFERTVVIKCMLEHFSRSAEFREMFLDEARLAARLFHPNIVQITDLGVAEERHFICMEYLPGEDLETLIQTLQQRGENIPIPLAARILLSACEGLEFAHGFQEAGRRLNLVHRDVSPSNVFLTFQGVVKLLDFGIAKASSRVTNTQPGTLKGKWGYMSPEQARGEPLDARSDLFSLGVTFYELLTGRRMVERDNEVGVLMALMNQDNPPPSSLRADIPSALDAIVLKAIARDREQRYQSAAELRGDLERFLSTSPITGSSQLAHYMTTVFGAAWVEKKSNIPTLAELGVIQPAQAAVAAETGGLEKTFIRAPDPLAQTAVLGEPEGVRDSALVIPVAAAPAAETAPAAAQPVLPSPPAARSPPSRFSGIVIGVVGALAALALVGGGAAVFAPERLAGLLGTPPAVQSQRPKETPALPLEALPTAADEAPELASAAPTTAEPARAPVETGNAPRENTAPSNAAAADAEGNPSGEVMSASGTTELAQNPVNAASAKRPLGAKAIELTRGEVNKVLQRRAARLIACGETFRAELPADKRVNLQFAINRTGKVFESKTSLAATSPGLSKCLLGQVQTLTFPRNVNDPEFRIELPLQFTEE